MDFKTTLAYVFEWWFLDAPKAIWQGTTIVSEKVLVLFSVRTCLLTLFLPWKRDIQSTENLSLDEKFRIWIGNLISRGVGFTIRIFTFIAGLLISTCILLGGFVLLIAFMVWPFASAILIGQSLALLFKG